MESKRIYEDSHKELIRLQKSSTNEIKIDLSKLDTTTKGELLSAITKVATKRIKEIESVILGVQ